MLARVIPDSPADGAAGRAVRFRRWRGLLAWLRRHETVLWWVHSGWALALGIGVMWLGSRNFAILRVAFYQIAFIWLTSLALPFVLEHRRVGPRLAVWLRLAVNYVHKNLYQQLLFFALPVYYASVTLGSRNAWFLAVLAVSATLSTFDVVYDRHLSVKRGLTAVFFAFNLFALANVALPVLWSVSNAWAMRVSALLAITGFATIRFPPRDLSRRPVLVVVAVVAVLLIVVLERGRGYIPPAPLQLASAEFGGAVSRSTFAVGRPVHWLTPAWRGQLHAVTAIRAPLGLRDRVRHRWSLDGSPVFTSAAYTVTGGSARGFRLWTAVTLRDLRPGQEVRVDVETEAGQLIGRARLPVRETPPGP
jgi:hypothetical protein